MRGNEREIQRGDLLRFVGRFQDEFSRREQSQQCQNYLSGLLLDGERKSVEPMAARLPGVKRQSLHHFVCHAPWSSEDLQKHLWKHVLGELRTLPSSAHGKILILDDTGFLKKGSHSVGVCRQYFGLKGRIENCQVLVSWHFSDRISGIHIPLRGELYLPESWTSDQKRMKKADVPDSKLEFRTKWQIALEMLDEFRFEIPHEAIVFDAGYGNAREFLEELDARGERYVAAIPSTMSFWSADVATHATSRKTNWRNKPPLQVVTNKNSKPMQGWQWLIHARNKNSRFHQWKAFHLRGSKRIQSKAVAIRVRPRTKNPSVPGKECWLIIEESQGEVRFHTSNLPAETSLKRLIELVHSRWPIEQGYQQLKEELGLDHYEGRSWPGFHHHVTLCFMAFDFLALLQYQDSQKKAAERPAA